ncbi:hypothetical protein [Methanolacinia paynteri]|uniref:hypothetical protein n=1 Tax=Methanolacinia paynteri TaxID=230356 RepID=UPI00064E3D57|nr:hypothetical protein [Methanolacinia paynteri]
MKIFQTLKDIFAPKTEEKEKTSAAGETPGKAAEKARAEKLPSQKVSKSAKAANYAELINGLISDAGYRNYTPVGIEEAVCPSCGKDLDSFPVRRIQCPSCSADIFVRTRASDKKKVLLTGDQLEEFEKQRPLDSGMYDTKMKNLAERMEKYSDHDGWVFISVLDEKDTPEYAEYHGRVIKPGSGEEKKALGLLIRPDSRARTKTWFNDPEQDTSPDEYEAQRKEWFGKYQ